MSNKMPSFKENKLFYIRILIGIFIFIGFVSHWAMKSEIGTFFAYFLGFCFVIGLLIMDAKGIFSPLKWWQAVIILTMLLSVPVGIIIYALIPK